MSLKIGKELLAAELPIDIVHSIRLWALANSRTVTGFLTNDIFLKLLSNEPVGEYNEDEFFHKIAHEYLKQFDAKGTDWIKQNIDVLADEFEKLLHRKKLSVEHIRMLRNTLKVIVAEELNDSKV